MRRGLLTGLICITLTSTANASPTIDRAVAEASSAFAIPQAWMRAVIAVESAGNARALSKSGAIGLMQIMPDTWTVLRRRLHLSADPYDPRDNVMAGTALLRELYDRFGPDGFLAAYNASPQRYLEYLTTGRPLTDETRAYLARIAPLLGDEALSRAVIAPGSLPDWHTASLFVASLGAQWETNSDTSPAAPPSRLDPQSAGLFAPLSARGAP